MLEDGLPEEEPDVLESSEEVEDGEQEIASMHLELEPLEDPIVEANEISAEPIVTVERIPEKEIMRRFAPKEDVATVAEIVEAQVALSSDSAEPEADEDTDVLNRAFNDTDGIDEGLSVLEKTEATEPDGAEISLLMQFGCDDEIIDIYTKDTKEKHREPEIKVEPNVENGEKYPKEKLDAKREEYKNASIGMLIRLVACSLLGVLLLLYEGFTSLGADLPGILNRDDYYISYVLIGLQLAVLCVLTSYKQIWDGAKKLLSATPNAYSVVSILCGVTLLYDVTVLFVDTTPPTFHVTLAIALALSIAWEWRALMIEKNSFEVFLADHFDGETTKKFTLRPSKGKNSTAEKMYRGGLDSSNNVYYPIEIEKVERFFDSMGNTSRKGRIPMLLIIPALALSLIIGVLALVTSGKLWVGIAGLNLALWLTLPIVATLAVWLPFDILNGRARHEGYSFASEGSMEVYSECNVAIFSDLHLFAKCSPAQVNLAFYDGTAKDVLLGCLNAFYKEVGGPMSEVFANAQSKKLGECRLTRVGKSGVEAVVGSNYSILVGSESFMARYGISFPNVILSSEDDKAHTLCVSLNGRATARIAVRYSINEPFEMFVDRLAEEGISTAVETYDPMINTELLAKLRKNSTAPISIVHMSAEDRAVRRGEDRERILFEASEEELGVIARRSRFNLAVALYAAKKMARLRKVCNLFAISGFAIGAALAGLMASLELVEGFGAFWVLLFWILISGAISAITLTMLPNKSKFSFDAYKEEKAAAKISEKTNTERKTR